MKFSITIIFLFVSSAALAVQESVMVSINKVVPQDQAAAFAEQLKQPGPDVQVLVDEYMPMPHCAADPSCTYWGVAILQVRWSDNAKYQVWQASLAQKPEYTLYSNPSIGVGSPGSDETLLP